MAKPKKQAKVKKQFELSESANKLISKLYDVIVKEVTKLDKKLQKGK